MKAETTEQHGTRPAGERLGNAPDDEQDRTTQDRIGRLLRGARWPVGLAVVGAVVWFGTTAPFRSNQLTLWILLGLLALSLTLVWGMAGIFSFGQGAFFGIGGYTYGVVAINLSGTTNESLTAVVAAIAVAAITAAALGYFMFYGNISDVYVAIITLATTLVLHTFVGATAGPQYRIGDALLGGYNGMVGIPPITWGWPGGSARMLGLDQFLVATALIALLVFLGVRTLLRRPFGRIVTAVRENELRTQLVGYDVRRYKLGVFSLGGALAGLAGAGYAAWGMFINPAVFGLQQAALIIIWVLVGGRRSLVGAFVGVALVQGLSARLGAGAGSVTPIVLGAVLIGVVLLVPQGLIPSLQRIGYRFRSLRPPPAKLPAPRPEDVGGDRDDTGPALRAENLSKSFGGLVALNEVTLDLPRQGVHCLIGPNGAGKSTLFNLLVGRYRPSAGRVLLGDEDITRRRMHERARRGLGIKLQVPTLYAPLSAYENLWVAAYRVTRDQQAASQQAADTLAWLGLLERAHDPAETLSHGQQQWLEIGVVLAAGPRILLLDEPTAGMTRGETSRTAELVSRLAKGASVVVVEHDMAFVRQLDAPTTVLHQGSVFASGRLEEIRQDERVLDVYLGRQTHA